MKKYSKRLLFGFCIMMMAVLMPIQVSAKSEVIMEKSKVSVAVGKSVQLRAIARGKSPKITWKSSDKKIATVSSSGKVKGKKTGKVTITAKANGVSAKCVVTVQSKKAAAISTAKKLYKERLNEYTFIQKFLVKDVTGDGIPDLIMENQHGAVFLDTYTPNIYNNGKPGIMSLGDGRNIYVNKKKKMVIGYDYEYSYPQDINGTLYRNITKSSYKVWSYKKYPTVDVLYEYAKFTGSYNGYMKRSSTGKGYWGNWVKISEKNYTSTVKSFHNGATRVAPKYSNTASNRKKYIK